MSNDCQHDKTSDLQPNQDVNPNAIHTQNYYYYTFIVTVGYVIKSMSIPTTYSTLQLL